MRGREPKSPTLEIVIREGSTTDKRLREFIAAFDDGLQAIALALSTPHDNSAEVKELAAKIRASRKALEQAINK